MIILKFFDLNYTGIINKNQWIQGIFRTGLTGFSESDLDSLFPLYDKNNSGQIDYKNFCSFLYGREPLNPMTNNSQSLLNQQNDSNNINQKMKINENINQNYNNINNNQNYSDMNFHQNLQINNNFQNRQKTPLNIQNNINNKDINNRRTTINYNYQNSNNNNILNNQQMQANNNFMNNPKTPFRSILLIVKNFLIILNIKIIQILGLVKGKLIVIIILLIIFSNRIFLQQIIIP